MHVLDEVVAAPGRPRDESRRHVDVAARTQLGVAKRANERGLAHTGRSHDHDGIDAAERCDASAIADAYGPAIDELTRHRAV